MLRRRIGCSISSSHLTLGIWLRRQSECSTTRVPTQTSAGISWQTWGSRALKRLISMTRRSCRSRFKISHRLRWLRNCKAIFLVEEATNRRCHQRSEQALTVCLNLPSNRCLPYWTVWSSFRSKMRTRPGRCPVPLRFGEVEEQHAIRLLVSVWSHETVKKHFIAM